MFLPTLDEILWRCSHTDCGIFIHYHVLEYFKDYLGEFWSLGRTVLSPDCFIIYTLKSNVLRKKGSRVGRLYFFCFLTIVHVALYPRTDLKQGIYLIKFLVTGLYRFDLVSKILP